MEKDAVKVTVIRSFIPAVRCEGMPVAHVLPEGTEFVCSPEDAVMIFRQFPEGCAKMETVTAEEKKKK